jgi:hypothetical protein
VERESSPTRCILLWLRSMCVRRVLLALFLPCFHCLEVFKLTLISHPHFILNTLRLVLLRIFLLLS